MRCFLGCAWVLVPVSSLACGDSGADGTGGVGAGLAVGYVAP